MIITDNVRDRISAHIGMPCHAIEESTLLEIIKAKHLNLVHLETGHTPITFVDGKMIDTNASKMARALNIILLKHFDTVDEFLKAFGFKNLGYINDLWSNEFRKPKMSIIAKLVKEYDIDPIFLYGTKAEEFIQQQTQTA